MMEERIKRKLSAILSADVVGYSRLMAEDELATVRTLEAYRKVMTDLIDQFRGRVVDSPGDNLLAEFSSVVDAVQCAVEIHDVLRAKNQDLPEHRRMLFRMGVNLGDVIEEGDRIYGDGVNIAARLEGLAEAGGICISGSAHEQIKNKLALGYNYIGEHRVKNIAEPLKVYRVPAGPKAVSPKDDKNKKTKLKKWQWAALCIIVPLVLVSGAVVIWNFYFRAPPMELASKEKMASQLPEKPPMKLPDKPSIAVLPFVNMSEDTKQEYFSDGITEDIITDLSKVSGVFVIARNASFSYKGKQVNAQDVAKDLGVRYVLEGSVRRSGNRLRITAQLIDAKTGDHLWAERYDRELKDVFSVQDEVTQKVVSELAVTLKASEMERLFRKHTESIEAYDLYVRILRECWPPKKECHPEAIELSKQVIELDPKFAGGYQLLSYLFSAGVRFGYSISPREDVEKALELAQQAVSIDDTFAPSYISLASAYLMKRQHEDALAAASAAVRIEPGGYNSNMWMGFYLHWIGRGEEAVKAVKKAQQLNPKWQSDPLPWIWDFMGFATFTAGRYEDSIAAWKQVLDRFGPIVLREAFLTAAYSELGRDEEAKAMAQQLLKRHPKFSLSSWNFARTYKNPEDTERLLNALRKAGLPD
ncbi:MAG: adenylate/guanylate cyclase domain-containing protein [Deltaproteobacteria bacterium]|nr:MAG: adenylate/guanylate cyclase domain-containing protein [Deltaproteobacteria bacterium]